MNSCGAFGASMMQTVGLLDWVGYGVRRLLFACVRGYQLAISPWLPPACRFQPSCSDYALETLQTQPLLRGLVLIAGRLARCQPLCKGGFDPVPPPPRGTIPLRCGCAKHDPPSSH